MAWWFEQESVEHWFLYSRVFKLILFILSIHVNSVAFGRFVQRDEWCQYGDRFIVCNPKEPCLINRGSLDLNLSILLIIVSPILQ